MISTSQIQECLDLWACRYILQVVLMMTIDEALLKITNKSLMTERVDLNCQVRASNDST